MRFIHLPASFMLLLGICCRATDFFDITVDWPLKENPSGVWSVNGPNDEPLPYLDDWQGASFPDHRQGAWAAINELNIPGWAKVTGPSVLDAPLGCIVMHAPANGQASITFTSPRDGWVKIAGGLWLAAAEHQRQARWIIEHEGVNIMNGLLEYTGLDGINHYGSHRPKPFTQRGLDPSVLNAIPVREGDIIRLGIERVGSYATFVGVDFKIWLLDDPVETVSTELRIKKAIALEFQTEIGRLYNLEGSEDLNAWTEIRSGMVGTGNRMEVFVLSGGMGRYFRLVTRR